MDLCPYLSCFSAGDLIGKRERAVERGGVSWRKRGRKRGKRGTEKMRETEKMWRERERENELV